MTRPYHFGRNKVHIAHWSAPRGYTTSITEAVAEYKAALPPRKAQVQRSPKSQSSIPVKTKSGINIFQRAWISICDHFKGIADDVLPRQTAANPNGDVVVPRLLVCLCCLR